MDEDLLADDEQFKDDGLEDLDLDEEAALLGLSDEEIEDKTLDETEEQDLEYNDENLGDKIDVKYIARNKSKRSSPDDDILDLDLDEKLDSFNQEDPEISRETPSKFYGEKQNKGNLIPLTLTDEKISPQKRRESLHSLTPEIEASNSNIAYVGKNLMSSSHLPAETYENEDLEFDEESEDENLEDDHRERFKSERNIITLTPAKKRTDIPDTLDSVISVEETAKVQAFLENEQKRKMRFKGRPLPRMKSATYSRTPQFYGNKQSPQQEHPVPQFPTPPPPQIIQGPSNSTQPRKILINPHFRGVRVPPPTSTESGHMIDEHLPMPMPYEQPSQNNLPPVYSHQDNVQQVNNPPPVYSTPPSTVPYNPPQHQSHPPVWQTSPPEILPPVSYSAPPPVINYGSQPPSYQNNYMHNYPNTNYQTPPPQISMPPAVSYNQPPPPIHLQVPTYTSPPSNVMQTNVNHLQFPSSQPNNQSHMQEAYYQRSEMQPPIALNQRDVFPQNQQSNRSPNQHQHQNQKYQQQPNLRTLKQNMRPLQQNQPNQHHRKQNQRQQNQQQNRFLRQAEKRISNVNIKEIPIKQPRMDQQQLKKNVHLNNPNIREIPLVDNLPSTQKLETKKTPIFEDEDEETKKLRLQIEEQKRLREQILKKKEERRRQMAAQRMLEVKKRQSEQSKNIIPLTQKNDSSFSNKQPAIQPVQAKLSVKERIGVPKGNKKIVVLKKKNAETPNISLTAEPKKIIQVSAPSALVSNQAQGNVVNREPKLTAKANVSFKPSVTATPAGSFFQKKKIISLQKKNLQINRDQKQLLSSENSPIITKYSGLNLTNIEMKQGQGKGPVQSRLGKRPVFMKKDFKSGGASQVRMNQPSPRFPGSRGPQFESNPFPNHQLRGPAPRAPLNEIRPPLMPSPPRFYELRPPLLPLRPPPNEQPYNQFGFEPNHPQFRHRNPGELDHPRFYSQGPRNINPANFNPQALGDPGHPHFRSPGAGNPNHFHVQGPEFPGFHPRNMDMYPPERFPAPPQFFNQGNHQRPMFEPNNNPMFQRPRFQKQKSNLKQRFSRPNNNQHQPQAVKVESTKTDNESSEINSKSSTVAQKDEKIALKEDIPDQKPHIKTEPEGPVTQTVSIENLSSSTNEAHLRKLCSTVGVIEKIELLTNERKAIIKFKEARQALNFQKKFQRCMLDLAMIQVSLVSP